jgi:hypothetical protein
MHQRPVWLEKFEIRKGQHLSPSTEFKKSAEWIDFPCPNCGKITKQRKKRIENGWTKGCCSKECGRKLMSGENHPNWKGKLVKEEQKDRHSIENKKWRMKCLVRDNFTCQDCGIENSWEVHHIKRWIDCPELRFDVNNGKTLCWRCHAKTKRKST